MEFVSKNYFRWSLELLAIFFLVSTLVIFFLPYAEILKVAPYFDEDHFIEWLSFIVLVFAGLNCFFKKNQTMYWTILGLLMVFLAMEEISWFQRMLNLDSPNFFLKWNNQQELNLHGLAVNDYFFEHVIILAAGFCLFPLFYQLTPRFFPVAQFSYDKLLIIIILVLTINFFNEDSQQEHFRSIVMEEGVELVIYFHLFIASLKSVK